MRFRVTRTLSFGPLLAILAAVSIPADGQVFSVSTSGNNVLVTVGYGLSGNQCCRGSSLDNSTGLHGIGATCSQPCGYPLTAAYTCNWQGTHLVTACWSDDHTNGYVCGTTTVDVTVPMPASCNPQPAD